MLIVSKKINCLICQVCIFYNNCNDSVKYYNTSYLMKFNSLPMSSIQYVNKNIINI